MRHITPTTVRRLAVSKQHLAGPRLTPNATGMMELLRDIRCLQLDPINTVARSHLLVLWSRLGAYNPADFEYLLWHERLLFEYWAHCASIVLSEDYPIHQGRMRRAGQGDRSWEVRARTWLEENRELRDHVLDTLRTVGPLPSAHFADSSRVDWASSGWTSGRNVPLLLNILWDQGVVTVAGRTGQQRLWALAEHRFPLWAATTPLNEKELVRAAAQLSLRALGVGRAPHIQNHFVRGMYPGLPAALRDLVAEESIIPIQITSDEASWSGTWYIHAADMPLLDSIEAGEWQPRTTLLSPFDNLICDRARTELVFDFFFRIEIYVPKAKRQYGYYVLPILHGDRLIGRIDPTMDRKTGELRINAVYAEPNAPADAATAQAVATAVRELGAFLGARTIRYSEQVPDTWRRALVTDG